MVRDITQEALKEELAVTSVYSFKIALRNTGSTDLEDVKINVELGEGATLAKVNVIAPEERPESMIELSFQRPRRVNLQIPVWKMKEQIQLEILSVDNENALCRIWTDQPHLKCLDEGAQRDKTAVFRVGIGIGFMGASILLLLATTQFARASFERNLILMLSFGAVLIGYPLSISATIRRRGLVRGILLRFLSPFP